MADPSNSLLSHKTSDSGLHIQLHPLVLLTISDHITRHAAREQEGRIIGALLGQHNGREITLEHAFECIARPNEAGEVQLAAEWFIERVKQFKDVHKDPPLDVVGWWSTAPPTGPNTAHLPIQRQILQDYNESAVFLAFHPSQLQASSPSAGKLPLSVYESVYEGDNAADGGKAMQVDNEKQSLNIRFRELPYSVETGEAEMIGMDTIARSGRNAAALEPPGAQDQQKAKHDGKKKDRGKEKEQGKKADKGEKSTEAVLLSPEEEELIASHNTRLNAIRTLESRISLIKSYLSSLPPSESTSESTAQHLSHPILRNINSLIAQLTLLTPQEGSPLMGETLVQNNDVLLVAMLGQLSESVKGMHELGKKAAVVQSVRANAASRKQMAMQSRYEEEYAGREGSSGGFGMLS